MNKEQYWYFSVEDIQPMYKKVSSNHQENERQHHNETSACTCYTYLLFISYYSSVIVIKNDEVTRMGKDVERTNSL